MGHKHKWFFLQARTEMEPAEIGGTSFRKIEYAWFVCNDCPSNNDLPLVIKVKVEAHGAKASDLPE